jgi:hypothetical protein
MAKPTYYLWKDKDTDDKKLDELKQKYVDAGFDVVIFNNTSDNKNIGKGLHEILKNHQ